MTQSQWLKSQIDFDCILTNDPQKVWEYLPQIPEDQRDEGGPFREFFFKNGRLIMVNFKGSAHFRDHYNINWYEVEQNVSCGVLTKKEQ